MNDLYQRFESSLIELSILLHDFAPKSVMEDMEFFITEPYMSSNCKTNTSLSFRIGVLATEATGKNVLLIRALYMLFNARDGILKGYPKSEIVHSLDNVDGLIKTANEWALTELYY